MKKKQEMLFDEPQARDTRGRFCTQERSLYERTAAENVRLRHEREQYYRAYLAVAKDNSRLQRELDALKAKIKSTAI